MVVQLREAPSPGSLPHTLTLLRDFDHYLGANQLSEATRRARKYWLVRFLAEVCPPDLAEVTEDHVARFIDSIGLRSVGRSQSLDALRSFFSWCHRRGHVAIDPAEALLPRKPPLPPVAAFTDIELHRFLLAAQARAPRRRFTLQLQYALACRRAEVAGIRAEDLDLESREVLLVAAKYGRPRKVPLGPLALVALEGLRPWGTPTIVGVRKQTITEWAEEAARASGLRGKTRGRASHILRATAATNMLARGVPISVVSEILGHTDVAVTSRYLATSREERRRAVERL